MKKIKKNSSCHSDSMNVSFILHFFFTADVISAILLCRSAKKKTAGNTSFKDSLLF